MKKKKRFILSWTQKPISFPELKNLAKLRWRDRWTLTFCAMIKLCNITVTIMSILSTRTCSQRHILACASGHSRYWFNVAHSNRYTSWEILFEGQHKAKQFFLDQKWNRTKQDAHWLDRIRYTYEEDPGVWYQNQHQQCQRIRQVHVVKRILFVDTKKSLTAVDTVSFPSS